MYQKVGRDDARLCPLFGLADGSLEYKQLCDISP